MVSRSGVAELRRNRWPACVGISGRFQSEYANEALPLDQHLPASSRAGAEHAAGIYSRGLPPLLPEGETVGERPPRPPPTNRVFVIK